MKKCTHIWTLLLAILFSFSLSAQNLTNAYSNSFIVEEQSNIHLITNLTIGDLQFEKVNHSAGLYYRPIIEGFINGGEIGMPALPLMNKLIEVPHEANVSIEIIESDYTDYELSDFGVYAQLMPLQESAPKVEGYNSKFKKDKALYKKNQFYSIPLVKTEAIGMMRERNLHRIQFSPLQYNPYSETIRVYTQLKVKIHFSDGDISQTIYKKSTVQSPVFKFPENLILNEISNGSEETIVTYPVKYVIVADSMFQTTLQSFIEWKKRKGFEVIEAYLGQAAVGNSAASIKSYLNGLYNAGSPSNPALSYILLIGDIAQLPAHQMSGHVSDLPYAEYNNDHVPEVYYGRFPAVDTTQLAIMIEKTLDYELYTFPDPNYLKRVVLVAGVDNSYGPTHANGQINYIHQTYIDSSLGLNPLVHLYPASSSEASQIRNEVSEGAGIVNYTAHGASGGWSNPSFTTSHVASLNNAGKYPLVITNACSTAEFDVAECFGEAMLRADQKGALGYIGGSDLTYWDEDYYWAVGVGSISANQNYAGTSLGAFDQWFHTHGENYEDWYITQSQIMMAGNLTVSSSGSNLTNYYWEIYHLFGDPSLMIYQGIPSVQTPVYNSFLPLGVNQFQVNCDPFSYVALSINDSLLGAGISDSTGSATLTLNNNNQVGSAELVITGQNLQPYFGNVFISTPTGPFLTYFDHIINDPSGNNDGLLDFGEQVSIDIELMNMTSYNANNITAKLRTNDPNVVITDSVVQLSLMQGLDTTLLSGAFALDVDPNCPDNHNFQFELEIVDGSSGVWNTVFYETLYSANPQVTEVNYDDAISGNGNFICEAGESGDMIFTLQNLGHSTLNNVNVTLSCSNPFVTVSNFPATINEFRKDSLYFYGAQVQFAQNTFLGTVVDFVLNISNSQVNESIVFKQVVGIVSEDFNNGNFQKFNWTDNGTIPWVTDTVEKFEGKYSAKSGLTPDNSSSILRIDWNVLNKDSIRFYTKVSSELAYDYLNFNVDGILKDQWSGSTGWERQAYLISSGTHVFEWEYTKDYYLSDGQDCAWLDYIMFPMTDMFESVDEVENELSISLFPNPTNSELNLQIVLKENEHLSFGLFNSLGQQVDQIGFTGNLTKGQHVFTFELNNLKPGVYLFVVNSDNHHKVQKIIVTQ